jgi:hypothetical protein
MATEVEIRNAIVERIKTFTATLTPPPLVLGRDISDALESGAVNDLRDENQQIHCIIVTQSGAVPDNAEQDDAEYDLWFDITQYTQYRSGEDTTNPAIPLNSDDEASIERERIIDAFKKRSALNSSVLQYAHPITFPRGSIGPFKPGVRTQIRVAKAQLRISNAYGCS